MSNKRNNLILVEPFALRNILAPIIQDCTAKLAEPTPKIRSVLLLPKNTIKTHSLRSAD